MGLSISELEPLRPTFQGTPPSGSNACSHSTIVLNRLLLISGFSKPYPTFRTDTDFQLKRYVELDKCIKCAGTMLFTHSTSKTLLWARALWKHLVPLDAQIPANAQETDTGVPGKSELMTPQRVGE